MVFTPTFEYGSHSWKCVVIAITAQQLNMLYTISDAQLLLFCSLEPHSVHKQQSSQPKVSKPFYGAFHACYYKENH